MTVPKTQVRAFKFDFETNVIAQIEKRKQTAAEEATARRERADRFRNQLAEAEAAYSGSMIMCMRIGGRDLMI